ncbi:cytochrome P450 734A1-like [Tasmannia lanceolata]|uniref:cytochrome P450 734A1-like n=1 Tax=Tasmannia lanceolata TaxID=3420 RepID=UPI004064AFE4
MPFVHEILHRASPFYNYWSKIYGEMFVYWLGCKPRVTVADLELIKEVLLNRSGAFEKIAFDPYLKSLFGDGLPAVHGEKWARHRKIANAAFNMERVKEWVPTIVGSTRNMLDKWEVEGGEKGEFEIEVQREFYELTADVISRTAFGSSFEAGKKIFQLQDEQIPLVAEAVKRAYVAGFRFVPTKKNIKMWRLDKEIEKSFRKLIENCGEVSENTKNLLGSMTIANKEEKEERIGVEEIVGECKTFYFAGKETTASLLSWMILLLGLHQERQSKAREEVLHLYGRHEIPTANTLNQLKLVGMIVDETLRLYPVVTSLLRQVKKDIQLGKLHIPAGTEVYIPLINVHHSVELWGEDAAKFNPLRFSKRERHHLAAHFPFGLGPMICVGLNLGLVEAKIALAMILQRFSFVVSPTYVHAPTDLLSLQPLHGAQVVFQKI